MRTDTPAFFCFLFAWNIFFHPLTFGLYVSWGLKWVSCRQHIYGSCFCIHSANLCLLVEAFLPGYPFYCHIVVVSYNPLFFHIVCCNLSFFVSNFVDLILLFSWWVWPKVCQFSLSWLKEPAFSFINFTVVSFISFSFISAQISMISFLLLILGVLVLLFPVVLCVKLGCLFDVFISWGRIVLL